ncbi:MAG TPA: hypothetical protein VID73_07835 [Ktedonobacterales bacterium]|jgi:hypothetical protein
MFQDWNEGREGYPFEGGHAERVVPAEGDPEAEVYRARLRQRERMAGSRWRYRAVGPRRFGLGRALWIALAVVVLVACIKPLAVLATIGLVLLFSLLAFMFLAAGALFVAARFVLGGRYPTLGARWPRPRQHLYD